MKTESTPVTPQTRRSASDFCSLVNSPFMVTFCFKTLTSRARNSGPASLNLCLIPRIMLSSDRIVQRPLIPSPAAHPEETIAGTTQSATIARTRSAFIGIATEDPPKNYQSETLKSINHFSTPSSRLWPGFIDNYSSLKRLQVEPTKF